MRVGTTDNGGLAVYARSSGTLFYMDRGRRKDLHRNTKWTRDSQAQTAPASEGDEVEDEEESEEETGPWGGGTKQKGVSSEEDDDESEGEVVGVYVDGKYHDFDFTGVYTGGLENANTPCCLTGLRATDIRPDIGHKFRGSDCYGPARCTVTATRNGGHVILFNWINKYGTWPMIFDVPKGEVWTVGQIPEYGKARRDEEESEEEDEENEEESAEEDGDEEASEEEDEENEEESAEEDGDGSAVSAFLNAKKPECQHAGKCFRTNPQHLLDYSHPPGHQPASSKRSTGAGATAAGNPKKARPHNLLQGLTGAQSKAVGDVAAQFREGNEKLTKEQALTKELQTQLALMTQKEKKTALALEALKNARQLSSGKHQSVKHAIPEDGFMTTKAYAKLLGSHGLLTLQPGKPDEGQHVFHIIAAAHGGPNHVDNFLFALGGTFNLSIGDKNDNVNCFLAGKAKARLAVDIAKKVAGDPSLHVHIDKRKKAQTPLYTTSIHRYKTADQLFDDGQTLMRRVRSS